jgi:hypothetical protein
MKGSETRMTNGKTGVRFLFGGFRSPITPLGLLPVVLCLLLLGCGPGRPERAPVHGKITFQGKPVTTGRIAFYPEPGRSASSPIAADGSYKLTTFEPGDGALLGKHVVTITATEGTGGPMPKTIEDEKRHGMPVAGAVKWLVPQKYSDRSSTPLRAVEVKKGENSLDFDLTP